MLFDLLKSITQLYQL